MRTFLLIVLTLAVCSCAGIRVKRANDVKNPDKGIVYALPQNIIVTNFIIEEKHTYRGPYAEYAKDLLSIDNVPVKNSTDFAIRQVFMNSYSMPDVHHYYYVYPACKKMTGNLSLDNQMILYGYNVECPVSENFPVFNYLKDNNITEYPFPDACNNGTMKERMDTAYKTVLSDSNFVKVPVLKKSLEAKTAKDKAEDAANHLMRVRKRMFKFISGAYELVPQAGTIEQITEELKREESEYLSLFIGKEYYNRFSVKLSFMPEKDTSYVIAWFSEKQGLSSIQKQGFVPITAEIETLQHLDTLKKYYNTDVIKSKKGLVYRIPCRTRVSLKLNNALISQKDFMISQMGVLKVMPSSVLRKTKSGVVLSPASE